MSDWIKSKLSGLLLILCIGVTAIPASSQDVTITLPDTLLQDGEKKLLPVTVTTINQDDSVLSGEITLNYDDRVIDIPQVESASTLLENASVTYNSTTRKIAFASDNFITGEGVLIYLQVQMKSDLPQGRETNLDISQAVFNEDDTNISVNTGRIATPDIDISPSDPRVTVNDTIQFSAQGDIFGPLNWSLSDNSIASISNKGVLIPDTTGNLIVTVTDSIGTSASTELFRINPEHLTDLSISTPDTSIQQTRTLLWPVEASELTGLKITSAQFELSFPNKHLKYQGFTTNNALLDVWSSPTVNVDQGVIKFAAAGSKSLSGSGPLVYFEFEVDKEASGSHTPDLRKALFNESLNPAIQEGTINIENAPDIIVEPDTMELVIGQQDTAHVEQGGLSPYTWQSTDTSVAKVGTNTGIVTGSGRGSTTVYAFDAGGLRSEPLTVQVHDVNIGMPDTVMQYPDSLKMPVNIDDLTSLGVFAYELTLEYDSTIVDFNEVHSNGSLSENMSISVNEDSLIKIAAAGTQALSGGGALLWLDFTFADSAQNGDKSAVKIKEIQLNEPGGDNPIALPSNGRIRIDGFPVVPNVQSPSDGKQSASILPKFDWQYDDEDATFEIELDTSSSLSTPLKRKTGIKNTFYQLKDTLKRNTRYYWRIRTHKGDTMSAWSKTRSFLTFNQVDSVSLRNIKDDATGVSLTPTFMWTSSHPAATYHLQVSTVSDFSSLVTDTSAIPDTSHTFQGFLDSETQYFWRVRAMRDGIKSNWSAVYSFTTRPQVSVSYNDGWNLVGLSVEVDNAFYQNLFPDSKDNTLFGFFGNYQSRDTMRIGEGYWLKFSASGKQKLSGNPIQSVQITLDKGWNLIAGPTDTVSWSAIEDPDGILIDNTLFGFDGFYQNRDAIAPGNGYWVRTSGSGTITLQQSSSTQKSPSFSQPKGFVKLILSDASGNRMILYFDGTLGNQYDIKSFGLPPVPPEHVFDIRLKDDRRLTQTSEAHIQLQGITPPLELEVTDPKHRGRQYLAETGNTQKIWSGDETVQFDTGTIQSMSVRPLSNSGSIPKKYTLRNNFPNPFNPSTTIRYGLPEKADVQLTIYNIEGRQIAKPVDSRQEAGWHTVRFDASQLASGVYFYEIKTPEFNKVRKMMLVK